MNDDMFDARTYGLLAMFDSLGFLPTTLTPDPEETAKEWKENLVAVITELYKMNDCLNKRVMELEQEVIHADEKVFYREINVKLSEDKIKAEAVKKFAEELTERLKKFVWKHNIPECMFNDVMAQLLKEYENVFPDIY